MRYLALAGERALSLDIEQAERQLARALDLCPGRRSRARVAAGAVGAGRAATGPAAGCQAGVSTGPRPLPRAGRAPGGRPRPDPPRARRPPARRPGKRGAARRGARPARGATRRAGARQRVRLHGRAPHVREPIFARRSRRPSGRSRWLRSSTSPSRHSRSTGAALPAVPVGTPTGSRTCAGRSSSRSNRTWDARQP